MLLAIPFAAGLLLAPGTSSASVAPEASSTASDVLPVSGTVVNPCNGENVTWQGTAHFGSGHVNFQGIEGTGSLGNTYRVVNTANFEMTQFRRWLYRIVLNLAREHHRRRARWRKLPLRAEPGLDPEVEAERRMGDAEMAEALRFLSPREREAIYLRFFQDAAYEDVAAIMRINESTSRVLVHRALDKLRDRLMRKEAKREPQ